MVIYLFWLWLNRWWIFRPEFYNVGLINELQGIIGVGNVSVFIRTDNIIGVQVITSTLQTSD
ncbi:hypothetical protein [Candidatus Hodgkinia cicadicola]|uniref:hypothetical protein n=1 Tax=Candidatus Hodgkinia cicadicola TaxID=573658 RepID=UPI001788D118